MIVRDGTANLSFRRYVSSKVVGSGKERFSENSATMPGNERLQQEDVLIPLLDFSIKHYIDHGDSLFIGRLTHAVPASRRKEVLLLAKERIRLVAGIRGNKRPGLLNPVPMLTKFQKEIEKIEREQVEFVLELLKLNSSADQDEIEYEALQRVISEMEVKDRAILHKDRSMLSTTFSKANRKTFVQGGAPGLVQQRR